MKLDEKKYIARLLTCYKDACGCLDEAIGIVATEVSNEEARIIKHKIAKIIDAIDDVLISPYRDSHPLLFEDELE